MKDDLEYLYECANKATKGRWHAVGSWVENESDKLPDIVQQDHDASRGPRDSAKRREADARYIAAAQPATVKALISEIRLLRLLLKTSNALNSADAVGGRME